MNDLSKARKVVWCATAAFVGLGAARWTAGFVSDRTSRSIPDVRLGADGKATQWWTRYGPDDGGAWRTWYRRAEVGAPPGAWMRDDDPATFEFTRSGPDAAIAHSYVVVNELSRPLQGGAGWIEGHTTSSSPMDVLAVALSNHERRRRMRPADAAAAEKGPWLERGSAHPSWSAEGGVLVARAADGRVLARLGEAGLVRGEATAPAFRDLRPLEAVAWSWYAPGVAMQFATDPRWSPVHTFADADGALVRVSIDPNALTADALAKSPLPADDDVVEVTLTRAVPACGPIAPVSESWPLSRSQGAPLVARCGHDVVSIEDDGRTRVIARLDDDEQVMSAATSAIRTNDGKHVAYGTALATSSVPYDVFSWTWRVRHVRSDEQGAGRSCTVRMSAFDSAPVASAVRVATGVVRPPVLALASAASPRPTRVGDLLAGIVVDPMFSGDGGLAWLAASLGIGAACAALARRTARRRDPSHVVAWTVIAAAAGPIGLVWQRIWVAREALAPCEGCGAVRAVDVETCPSCASRWPAPNARPTDLLLPA